MATPVHPIYSRSEEADCTEHGYDSRCPRASPDLGDFAALMHAAKYVDGIFVHKGSMAPAGWRTSLICHCPSNYQPALLRMIEYCVTRVETSPRKTSSTCTTAQSTCSWQISQTSHRPRYLHEGFKPKDSTKAAYGLKQNLYPRLPVFTKEQ